MMEDRVTFHDLHPSVADMKSEVLEGLSQRQKRISPKFFYDRAGSQLFDAITELTEYYPTRTEIQILQQHSEEMAQCLGRDALLVELGSGSSRKVRVLLDALSPAIYMPVDISKAHLLESTKAIAASFPGLAIHATCADYSSAFEFPHAADGLSRVAFFPGSSIGNFEPREAQALLARIGDLVGAGGKLLIGVDLLKDADILNAAYDDAQQITAAFNLNLLRRINRELDADFDLDAFAHRAFFNDRESRVEMHLVSRRSQVVTVAGKQIQFRSGETIHTENSHKYSLSGFRTLAREAGFEPERVWTDSRALFSVHCLAW